MLTREDYTYAHEQASRWAGYAAESARNTDKRLAEALAACAAAEAAWALYYACVAGEDSDKFVADGLADDLAAERAFYGEIEA